VKALLDTSVLVATFYDGHEHHKSSFELFVNQEKGGGCAAAHSLAEMYFVFTGMPGKERASGDEALLFLGNIRDRLTIVNLDPEEYFRVAEAAAGAGLTGGGIYDAILGKHLHLEHQALRTPRRGHCRPRENSLERGQAFQSIFTPLRSGLRERKSRVLRASARPDPVVDEGAHQRPSPGDGMSRISQRGVGRLDRSLRIP
jgi:predicted nucleic acid-binding protein